MLRAACCVLSGGGVVQYNIHIPARTTPINGATLKGGFVSCSESQALWADLRSGMLIVWKSQRIRWRIIFLALETACEDAMVSLVIAEYAIAVLSRGADGENINFAKGNLLAGTFGSGGSSWFGRCSKVG